MAEAILTAAAVVTLAAMAISFVRFLLGPDGLSRVVALDALTIMALSLIAMIAYLTGRVIYLDVALVYGLISFLGVLAMARYRERGF